MRDRGQPTNDTDPTSYPAIQRIVSALDADIGTTTIIGGEPFTPGRAWIATLAPTATRGKTGVALTTDASLTVTPYAPLCGPEGNVIGIVKVVTVADGYVTVGGFIFGEGDLPAGRPTFDLGLKVDFEFNDGHLTYSRGTISAVRVGAMPIWSDPSIRITEIPLNRTER